jgi:hypothetical protein
MWLQVNVNGLEAFTQYPRPFTAETLDPIAMMGGLDHAQLRSRDAHHEAGHAVVGMAFGLPGTAAFLPRPRRQPRRVGAASPGTYQWVRSLQSSATSWRFTLLVFERHIVGSLTRACSLQPLLSSTTCSRAPWSDSAATWHR